MFLEILGAMVVGLIIGEIFGEQLVYLIAFVLFYTFTLVAFLIKIPLIILFGEET